MRRSVDARHDVVLLETELPLDFEAYREKLGVGFDLRRTDDVDVELGKGFPSTCR